MPKATNEENTMWHYRLTAFLVASLLIFGTAQASQTRDPQEFFFQESFGDFQEEVDIAREEGKTGVFVFFEMDECPFCHYMKTHVLNQKSVQDYYRENFRIVTVDIEGDVEVTDFDGTTMKAKDFALKRHRVRATPVLAFFDLEGNRVFRFTGKTTGADEFIMMGEFVTSGAYKEQKFNRYKRAQRDK